MKKLMLLWMVYALPAWAAEAPVGAYVELRGAPKKVQRVLDQITKEDAYQSAQCNTLPANKNGNIVGISCKNPDSALIKMLNLGVGSGVKLRMSAQGCPTGCINMACPPLNFPVACCKKTSTGGYQRC